MFLAQLAAGVAHPLRRSDDCLGFGRCDRWCDGGGGREDATHQKPRHIAANALTWQRLSALSRRFFERCHANPLATAKQLRRTKKVEFIMFPVTTMQIFVNDLQDDVSSGWLDPR
jgi:hypothetical protein